MTILRLDCVATLRQGSMSIPEHGLRVLTRPRARARPPNGAVWVGRRFKLMALRARESARRHLVSGPCLPYPELVDPRAAFGVECEVTGSAGEQVGGGGAGEWHPCGLVDG